jgi:hypothetical protein
MQKTVLTFGIISGLIIVVLWMATRSLWMDPDGQMDMFKGEIIGYTNMIVALSMIFFGIRQYREGYMGGQITFGKAFKVGLFITLIASAIYVIWWMVYFNTSEVAQSFPEQYLQHMKEQWAASGMSSAEVQQKTEGFEKNMELYKNPLVMAGMTLMEILPVGLIVTLISALILKRKPS